MLLKSLNHKWVRDATTLRWVYHVLGQTDQQEIQKIGLG